MPTPRGTFQGNLSGTGSRVLEMLTSSKAVTASYAGEADKLTVGNVGNNGIPVYFQAGVPVTDSKTKTVVDWVTANSSSITGITGSSSDTNVAVQGLLEASGSWNSASNWISSNSGNLLAKTSSLKVTASLGVPTASSIIYTPNGGAKSIEIKVPSNPGHIGAASASHTHKTTDVTGLDAITASVNNLVSKTSSYVTTTSFNNYTSSALGAFLPITGGTITGDLVVNQNLTVKGTTVSVDATNLNVKDKLILVASGSTTQAAADGAGIAVSTASAGEGGAARIQYRSSDNRFTASVGFVAPSFTGSLKGNVTGTSSYATNAATAVSAGYSTSASEAIHAANATSASYALTASYLIGGASLNVDTASHANEVPWSGVTGAPSFYSASFAAGAFSAKTYGPTSGSQTINIPTNPGHVGAASASHTHSINQITGLNAYTASVNSLVSKSASWDGMATTASNAYASASKALATASVAQREAESASYWKTEASKSAASASVFSQLADGFAEEAETFASNAELYAAQASGAMEDARIYRANAATNATLSSTYAVQSSASAVLAAASASAAHNSKTQAAASASAAATSATNAANAATRAQASASAAHTSKTLAAASASAAHTSKTLAAASASAAALSAASASASASNASQSAATAAGWAISASASANQIQADTTIAANWAASSSKYATNASASASLMYKNVGSATQPIYLTTAGPQTASAYSSLFTNFVETKNVLTASIGGTTKYATITSASYANNATSASEATHAANATTASYALIAEAVKDGAGLVVNTASFALDHYKPTTASGSAIGTTAARTYIKAINVDKNNHVISVTTGSETVTDTDRYVNTASFASTGSNGANGVKMTLTRKGSDTGTVVATIPVVSATAAGVATGAQFKKWETGSSWVTANSGNLMKLSASSQTVQGNVIFQGNVTVGGTVTTVNATDVEVTDRLILLASASASPSRTTANGGGIAVMTGSATSSVGREAASARFQYDGTNNVWTASVGIKADNGFTGSLQGTAATASYNAEAAALRTIITSNSSSWAKNDATTYAGHYTPSASGASSQGSTAARTYLKTVNIDGKGHVVGFTTGSETVTNTDRYVNTASFASTGSSGSIGVKMTLTRAGSDTTQVTATIPVATGTAAGVMTGAMVAKLNGIAAGATANTGTVTSVTVTTASTYVTVDNAAAITTTGTRKIDLAATTKNKIESGSLAFTRTTGILGITASLVASASLAKTAIQPSQTASWASAATWVAANSASSHTHSNKATLDSITGIDSAVTSGSNKLVTSDAVYQAITEGGTRVIFRQW